MSSYSLKHRFSPLQFNSFLFSFLSASSNSFCSFCFSKAQIKKEDNFVLLPLIYIYICICIYHWIKKYLKMNTNLYLAFFLWLNLILSILEILWILSILSILVILLILFILLISLILLALPNFIEFLHLYGNNQN